MSKDKDLPDIVREELKNLPDSAIIERNKVNIKNRNVEIYDESGDPEKDLIILKDHRDGLEEKHLETYWKIIEKAKEEYYDDYESEELSRVEREKKRLKKKYLKKIRRFEKRVRQLEHDIYSEMAELEEELENEDKILIEYEPGPGDYTFITEDGRVLDLPPNTTVSELQNRL